MPSVPASQCGSTQGHERERIGVAMLLVEQNIQFALEVSDRWAVLKLIEINETGASDQAGAAARVADRLAV